MKKLGSFLVIALLVACGRNDNNKVSPDLVKIDASATGDQAAGGMAVITFEKTEHDFGNLTEGEVLEYDFRFTNTGEQDLLIANAQASCGCTVPEYSKEPVAPGKTGRIRVQFNSDKRAGPFNKQITVTANTSPPETMLTIKGVVKERPSATPMPGGPIH
jgi:hypothetical protein